MFVGLSDAVILYAKENRTSRGRRLGPKRGSETKLVEATLPFVLNLFLDPSRRPLLAKSQGGRTLESPSTSEKSS